MYVKRDDVKGIVETCFPDYKGTKFQLETATTFRLREYWDGGSREYTVLYRMADGKLFPPAERVKNPFHLASDSEFAIPAEVLVVKHVFFCGHDMGIRVLARPENLAPMLPEAIELAWAEKVVLTTTRSLKASYNGTPNYRFVEANRQTGITYVEWCEAKEALQLRKLLNKQGAITNKGRNVIGALSLYGLRRQT